MILPKTISDNQSEFVYKRKITDNTMISYEIFTHINKTNKRKKGFVRIKLDMEKSYDKLNWNFIHKTLIGIGLPNNIINLTMKRVNTVSLSILINGHPTKPFKPTRGIRQGYPLLPYLFILCANVFSNLITQVQGLNKFKGISIAGREPNITQFLCVCI